MKIWFTLLVVVSFFVIGCSDSALNPENTNQNNDQKSWITLPKSQSTAVESDYSASKVINGETGGSFDLNIKYPVKGGANVKIKAKIEIPAGAYTGEKNITMIINSTTGTATFSPNTAIFYKPLIFDLDIQGIDLSGVDPKSIDFVCLNTDGSFEPVEYKKIKVKVNKGELEVNNALIPHFSIFGWTR
ncbi:MAG: hypothetical protein WCE54_18815 [Ignavibacteriaceae bacterium]